MRAKEFITEGGTGSLAPGVANALPAAYALPELQNQDAYLQYRFGLALAAARANKQDGIPYNYESVFGENMLVVTRSKEEEETLNMALTLFGRKNAKKLISTSRSEESPDVNKQSPVVPNTRKLNKG